MKIIKEITDSKPLGFSQMLSPHSEIATWFSENTLAYNNSTNSIMPLPFTQYLMANVPVIPTDFKPGATKENSFKVLVKNVAIRNEDNGWDVYDKVVIHCYMCHVASEKTPVGAIGVQVVENVKIKVESVSDEPNSVETIYSLFDVL